jgi:hypothetical protein
MLLLTLLSWRRLQLLTSTRALTTLLLWSNFGWDRVQCPLGLDRCLREVCQDIKWICLQVYQSRGPGLPQNSLTRRSPFWLVRTFRERVSGWYCPRILQSAPQTALVCERPCRRRRPVLRWRSATLCELHMVQYHFYSDGVSREFELGLVGPRNKKRLRTRSGDVINGIGCRRTDHFGVIHIYQDEGCEGALSG